MIIREFKINPNGETLRLPLGAVVVHAARIDTMALGGERGIALLLWVHLDTQQLKKSDRKFFVVRNDKEFPTNVLHVCTLHGGGSEAWHLMEET